MQIGAISVPASSSTQWNAQQAKSGSVTASLAISDPSAVSSAADQAFAPAPANSASFSVPVRDSASNSQIATLAEAYSTTVAGKSYAASVEELGGVFTASVPMPPGLSASGDSVESAEINLSIVLDTLA